MRQKFQRKDDTILHVENLKLPGKLQKMKISKVLSKLYVKQQSCGEGDEDLLVMETHLKCIGINLKI